MLMNMYCNDHMNYNDGTCCSSPEPITTVQTVVAAVFAVSLLLAIILVIYRRKTRRNTKNGSRAATAGEGQTRNGSNGEETQGGEFCESLYAVITSLAKMGLILGYVFLCDRTNFFMKENKHYTHVNFFLPFSYLMILGFFFTENTERTRLLHRDQTDEWKGWMQLVILIYHLTGASRVLPIYMQIRVLVSSYLFLTGFGHFYFFWEKGDYSLDRLCKVLFRLNFLVVMLCLVMNRPYQFYYYVPLVSFWFIMVYLVMAIWPHVTAASTDANPLHYLYLVLKVAVVVVLITLLFASEVFFEKVFLSRPFKPLFVTSDDSIHEWWFRWRIDRYSATYGLLFALLYHISRRFRLIDDSKDNTLFSKSVSWIIGVLSVLGLLGYATFSSFCRNKAECNDVHPYISFLPIVSYTFLRNIPGWLRTKYSCFFAWFGKISLELFIAQYHIWLAADTHGVLVLVPSYPVMNIIITSFIFVCIAHEISTITVTMASYCVPKDWKLLLRNIVCFLGIIIPIGITQGAFGF